MFCKYNFLVFSALCLHFLCLKTHTSSERRSPGNTKENDVIFLEFEPYSRLFIFSYALTHLTLIIAFQGKYVITSILQEEAEGQKRKKYPELHSKEVEGLRFRPMQLLLLISTGSC